MKKKKCFKHAYKIMLLIDDGNFDVEIWDPKYYLISFKSLRITISKISVLFNQKDCIN